MNRLKAFWHLLNLPCEGMARLVSESLDRDLGPLERFAMRLHLLYCVACRRFLRQVWLMRSAMRRLENRLQTQQPLPGPELPEDVRERIKRRLTET